ncbi:MAG: ATP-binding cassette domain-containing protein [Myxococcales bacterium]|nr:MAG: ATP-binding cassette domain-containing protein [Myxococcales bacterium]
MSDVMIEARDLTKHYGPVTELKNATFEVNRGEVVGFLGPNGAGKTTTMKILTCFIAPSDGTARVAGADIFEDPIAVREAIGYLPENTPLYSEMLVLEYLEFAGKMRGLSGEALPARIRKVVEETSLGDVIGKSIGELSKGFRQRVGLAQALIHEPPVLILDEPMSGLDPNQASEIRELIREIGRERTIILSTHNLAEVQVTCGRVLIISQGELVADDTPEELAARAGKPRFIATLRRNGHSAAEIRAAFSSIADAGSVAEHDGAGPNELVIEVVPKGSQDLRADIFQAAVSANLVLLGLEQRGENLEDVFRQLTTAGEGVAS